jgi:hypothetical protein
MTDAIRTTSEAERALDAGRAKARKAVARDALGAETVAAPTSPDGRGQLVDKEA